MTPLCFHGTCISFLPSLASGFTATVDAYLTPLIKRYIENFSKGFDDRLAQSVQISFMRSDGGLAPVDRFRGSSSILSGPAGE